MAGVRQFARRLQRAKRLILARSCSAYRVLSTGKLPRATGRAPSAFQTISDRALWDCTTCGACVFECPVNIEVYDKVIDLRRQLVEMGRVSPATRTSLDGLRERQNPWDYSPAQRTVWSEGLKLPQADTTPEAEWVYWIGCAGSFEASAQSISRSMVNILRQANVSFVTLGCEERCTGDPARRLGDEAVVSTLQEEEC